MGSKHARCSKHPPRHTPMHSGERMRIIWRGARTAEWREALPLVWRGRAGISQIIVSAPRGYFDSAHRDEAYQRSEKTEPRRPARH